jgi:hypothetical protein
MLIDRANWPEHRPWVLLAVASAVGGGVVYALDAQASGRWPGGGSRSGFALGVAGGLIIIFEMLLLVRKKLRAWRLGRTKVWMAAHLWLGLLTVPFLVLHSGFHWWGGALSGVLMVLFLVVILSGLWGLALQQFLPSRILAEVPAETIHSQVPYLLNQYHEEAGRLVAATCGLDEAPGGPLSGTGPGEKSVPGFLVVGVMRSAGRVQGKALQTRLAPIVVPGSEPLLQFFETTVSPFLRARRAAGFPLFAAQRAAAMFRDLKTQLDPAAHAVVDELETLCDQRRQLDHQLRLHSWLHSWLLVHLPLSTALFILMIVHIFVALKYF